MSETAIQAIGYVASAVIVLSLCFPTHTKKSTLMLRIINMIGSALFMTFGLLTPDNIPTAVLNGATIVVDIVQIVLVLRKKPEDEAKKEDDKEQSESNVTCDESSGEQKDAE